MRRRAARLAAVLVTFVVVVAVAIVTGAGAGTANNDWIQGGFTDKYGENIGMQAKSGPAGQDPQGHESATTPGPEPVMYRLKVKCLAVQGNLAAYGTVVTKTNDPNNPPGTEFVEVVRDGGLPHGGGDGWDIFDAPASTCADFVANAATAAPIGGGNLSIHDAP